MSYELEKWARMQVVGNSTAKYVLRELAYCHNRDTGLCCPAIKTLSATLELSKNPIKAAIKYLITAGFLKVKEVKAGNRILRTEYYFPKFDGSNSDGSISDPTQINESDSDPSVLQINESNSDPLTTDGSNSDPLDGSISDPSNSDGTDSDGSNSDSLMGQILTPNREYITKNTINNSKVNISKTTEEKLGGLRGEVQTVDTSTKVDPTEDDGVPPWETQARKQWIAQTSELTSTNTSEPATATTVTTATTAPCTPQGSASAPIDSAPAHDQGKGSDPDYAVVKGMRVPYDAVFDLYNEIAEGHFCTVRDRNKKRKSAIHARLTDLAKLTKADSAEKLLEELRQVLMNGANSSFCCGSKGWRLDFDTAFTPSKFSKLYENGYADSPKESRARPQADLNRPEKLPEVRDMTPEEIMTAHLAFKKPTQYL